MALMKHQTRTFTTLILIALFTNIETSNAETEYSLLTNIDEKLNNAFETLSRAEENGATINELIIELNTAISLYQELKTAVKEGDTEKATIIARECELILSRVSEWGNKLAEAAIEHSRTRRESRDIILHAAVVIVIISSLTLWIRFKQYYTRKALETKPTVI